MSNGYDKFFKTAGDVRRGDAPRKPEVKFEISKRSAASSENPEAALRQALNVRKKKNRHPTPWRAIIGLGVGLVLGGAYLADQEAVESWLSKIEIRAMGSASAADAPAKAKSEEKAAPEAEKTAEAKPAGDQGESPDAKPVVREDLSHYEKLQQRKAELDLREKELAELEEELQKQKVELDKRIQQLEETRDQIAQILKDRVQMDQEKVNKLIELYSNMKPKQAADIIGSLNEDLAVEVLAKMKKKNAAEIMNLLPPEKARVLSEKYTGYRRSIATQDNKG